MSTERCEQCDGEGTIDFTYAETGGAGYGMDNETAVRMAGAIHHTEACETCKGTGRIETIIEDED